MVRVFLICFLLPFSLLAKDQEVGLKAKIKQLVELRQATLNAPDDEQRIAANKEFIKFLRDALMDENSFKTPMDTIPQLADLRSGDGFFRMINWNLPFDDQTHRYYCFVQFYNRKEKAYEVVELKQGYRDLEGESRKVFTNRDWYGALYYQVIPAKTRSGNRKKTYMILGWDGHDQYSTIKVIDVMTITGGNIRFGADIFDYPERNVKRIILEYKSDASVSLRYDQRRKLIVFNKLVPMQPELEGMYEFYIPMLEFSALEWKKRKWRYMEDVNVRMEDDNKKYVDPPAPQDIRR